MSITDEDLVRIESCLPADDSFSVQWLGKAGLLSFDTDDVRALVEEVRALRSKGCEGVYIADQHPVEHCQGCRARCPTCGCYVADVSEAASSEAGCGVCNPGYGK